MPLSSRTNRWASRLVIILQLATWSTVSVVLLQKGVSSLQRRILETSSNVIKTDPSIDLDIEPTILSAKRIENDVAKKAPGKGRSSIGDNKTKIIIRIDQELPVRDDWNDSESSVIKNVSRDGRFQIVSEEQRSTLSKSRDISNDSMKPVFDKEKRYKSSDKTYLIPPILTIDRTDNKRAFGVSKYRLKIIKENGPPGLHMKDHLMATNQRIDDPQRENASNKILRITRDRERVFLNNRISESSRVQTSLSVFERKEKLEEKIAGPEPILKPEENNDAKEDYDFVENRRHTISAPSAQTLPTWIRDNDKFVDTSWRNKSRIEFARINGGGTAAAVTMVAIGAIMLILGPVALILRALDERRQMRKFIKLSGTVRDDLPPTYEQAILMTEAPRYSTLVLDGRDDGRSSPS